MIKIRRQQVFCLGNPNDIIAVASTADIAITEVTLDNVGGVVGFRGERFEQRFREFLKEGQYGVYAWLDSKVVGHAWARVCHEHCCRVNGYMDIRQKEALIHFCRVKENQRGKSIYPAMLVALCQRLFAESRVSRVLIDTWVNNDASLRGIAKVGFKPLGTRVYVQFLDRLVFKHFTRLDCEAR